MKSSILQLFWGKVSVGVNVARPKTILQRRGGAEAVEVVFSIHSKASTGS